MFVYSKKKYVFPNLQQMNVSLVSIRSLNSHGKKENKTKSHKANKIFVVITISKKAQSSAVCDFSAFGGKSSPYKDELSLRYSVSTFHCCIVSSGYCPWWIMNRKLKQSIYFCHFFPIIEFNCSLHQIWYFTPAVSHSFLHSSVYPCSVVMFIVFEHTKYMELCTQVKQFILFLSRTWLGACLLL